MGTPQSDEHLISWSDNLALMPKKPGVYVVMNRKNRRCYVGAAENLHVRASQHWTQIRQGTCGNMPLRRDVIKYGASNFFIFAVAVVENLEEAESFGGLAHMEWQWTLLFNAHDEATGYNCALVAGYTRAARFRDRERKMLRYGGYVLLAGVDLYDPIDKQLLDTWEPVSYR